MNKRQKTGLLIIIVGLLIIGAVVYFFFLSDDPVPGQVSEAPIVTTGQLPEEDLSNVTPGDRPRNNIKYDISQESEHTINSTDVAKIASSFAERLGSYSNQSNYSNFEDLNIFMTASMRSWALDYVDQMRKDNPYDGNYYGITTKAIATEVVKFDDEKGEAEIIISTQRREVKINGGENVFNQDIKLIFVKENNQWLVDGAYWLK